MIEVLKTELSGIAWKMVCAVILAAALGLLWKLIERKILARAEKKAYEIKKKKLDKLNAAQKIHVEKSEPTYEEWKAQQEKET